MIIHDAQHYHHLQASDSIANPMEYAAAAASVPFIHMKKPLAKRFWLVNRALNIPNTNRVAKVKTQATTKQDVK